MNQIQIKTMIFIFAAVLLTQFPATLFAQNLPKIGYLYPAGGQRGTTFQIVIGGRQIARANDVIISGNGIHAKIIHGYQGIFANNGDETAVIRQLYHHARGQTETKTVPPNKDGTQNPVTPEDVKRKYLYIDRLDNPTDDDLQLIYYQYFSQRLEKRPKETLAQAVLVEVTVDAEADPGVRDLRLLTPAGLTPPVRFVVGTLPEVNEFEPNDFDAPPLTQFQSWGTQAANLIPKNMRLQETFSLPVVLNGQIRAADVDRFTFRAKAKQKLVIATEARSLLPYLADAVPGWFQASLTLYDSDGNVLAQAASYQLEPDPVLPVEIPQDGLYSLEIRDAIFRGRDDFVYRVSVAESPLVASVFPLGTQTGTNISMKLDGWNLPTQRVALQTPPKSDAPTTRTLTAIKGTPLVKPILYPVDTLPEAVESEPNDVRQTANTVKLPVILNGRMDMSNDTDRYSFNANKDETLVFDVAAVSLGSAVDTNLEIVDAKGNVVASNDDRADSSGPNIGLETHHADPYLIFNVPEDGNYTARIFGVFFTGTPQPSYRLRISPPRPDFEAFCEPASITFAGKNTQPVKFHIVRKDGFQGEIRIRPSKAFTDWKLENAVISAKETQITATLTAPQMLGKTPVPLAFEAVAFVPKSSVQTDKSKDDAKESQENREEQEEFVRDVMPVIDMEQAFIYHHLVPTETLLTVRTFPPQKTTARKKK